MLDGDVVHEFGSAGSRIRSRLSTARSTSGPRANSTSDVCTWVLPEAHALESWGDAIGIDGSLCMRQPLIAPLMNGRSALKVLGDFAGLGLSDHEITQETFAGLGARPQLARSHPRGFAGITVTPRLTSSRPPGASHMSLRDITTV